MIEKIVTGNAPSPVGPYSQAVRAGGFIFVAGQIGLDPSTGRLVASDIRSQARRVMENIKAILESAGSSLDRLVKVTIFLKDLGDFAACNEIYGEYVKGSLPPRSTAEVTRLPKDALLEVDAIALA